MAVDIRTDTGGLTTTYVYDLMDRLTSTSVTDAQGRTAFIIRIK